MVPRLLGVSDATVMPRTHIGHWAEFIYLEEEGQLIAYLVTNWVRDNDQLEAYCTTSGTVLTFWLDRIQQWKGWGGFD